MWMQTLLETAVVGVKGRPVGSSSFRHPVWLLQHKRQLPTLHNSVSVCRMRIHAFSHMCAQFTACRRRTGSSAGVTLRLSRCQQTKPRQTSKHFTSTLTPTMSHSHPPPPPPPPPRLPPIVTRSVFLPLRPPFSGLDGHHCRGEVAFIHGHDRRPNPGKGAGGDGGEKTNTHHQALKLGATGHLASFSMPR